MEANIDFAGELIRQCRKKLNPSLDLGNCGLDDLYELPELFQCVHLKTLILSSNWKSEGNIEKYSSNGRGLFNGNRIGQLPTELSNLKGLVKLVCRDAFSSSFGHINQHNLLVLSKLFNLKYLDLSNTKIFDLGFLENLTELEYLDVSENNIVDCGFLLKLTKLRYANLRNNKIKELPSFIFRLGIDLNINSTAPLGLCVDDNPIETPPVEILKQGNTSIMAWFKATKMKLNEIKLILIGEPKAGKTSLLRRLKDNEFDSSEQQTDGINIENIQFGTSKTFAHQKSLHQITGHFWDFGGQEIMNSTHQFFLTNRSVYVLVLDARKDTNIAGQIRQWVKRVKVTGGNSPIIIVASQIDINRGFGFSNEYELQQEFPQIKCFIKISCQTSEGIETVKEKLEELIPQAELFSTQIDTRWISIMKKLQQETRSKYYLDEARFIQICSTNKITDSAERKNAINFLHDLGLVLHFENLNLSEYYVVDPYWITYGVYQIVTSSYAGIQKGIVHMDKLDYILNEEIDKKQTYRPIKYKKIVYDNPNQRRFLVDILNQFKLCFYLPDQKHFIIPDLLDTTEPAKITKSIRNGKNTINFIYEYDYLPNSILPHIMVTTHNLLLEKWRTGCVMENNDCKALVVSYQNRISIAIVGEHKKKREFMAVIRYVIDGINKDLSNKPKKLVPLIGINAFAEYEVLVTREKKGRKEYIHDEDKPTERIFEISHLLDGISNLEEIKDIHALVKGVLGSISNQLGYLINQSTVNQKELFNAIEEISKGSEQTILYEIMGFLASIFDSLDMEIDEKLRNIFVDLKKTDNIQMKLKLSIPLINILGVNFSTEIDIKKWTKDMYEKYQLNIFKLAGIIY